MTQNKQADSPVNPALRIAKSIVKDQRLLLLMLIVVIMAVVGVRLIVKKRSKNIFSTLLFFV